MTFGQEHAQDQSNTNEILADTIQKRQLINAGRMQLHIMIARLQNKVDVTDGVYDKLIDRDGDINKTTLVSNAIFGVTDKTVAYIENNESDDMLKRKYLGRVIDNLKLFNNDNNDGLIDEKYYASIFEHTYQLIRGFHNHNVVDYVRNHIDKAMFTLAPFVENDNQASVVLMEEMAEQYPEVLIKKIRTIKNEEAANVIVRKSAPKNPKIILNYATSTAIENSIVRRNKDPYVKQIVKIADSATIPLKAIFL